MLSCLAATTAPPIGTQPVPCSRVWLKRARVISASCPLRWRVHGAASCDVAGASGCDRAVSMASIIVSVPLRIRAFTMPPRTCNRIRSRVVLRPPPDLLRAHCSESIAAFAAQLETMCLALGSAMVYGIDLTRIRSRQRIRLRDARLCGAHRTTEHGRLPRTKKLHGLHVHNRMGRVLHRLSTGRSKQQKGAGVRREGE